MRRTIRAAAIAVAVFAPVCLALLCSAPTQQVSLAMTGFIATDNFDSYSDSASIAGLSNWDSVDAEDGLIYKPASDGEVMGNSADGMVAYWVGTSGAAANQFAQITITATNASGDGAGAAVRCSSNNCYVAFYEEDVTTIYLTKNVAGSGSLVTSAVINMNPGDIIRLEVTGTSTATRLTVKVNGTAVITSADPGSTYIDSGAPGFVISGLSNTFRADDWIGGNL